MNDSHDRPDGGMSTGAKGSVALPDLPLAERLEEARRGLLDLSTRNRLLSLPQPGRSRGVVRLDGEDAAFVLATMLEGRAFSFEAAAPEPPDGAPRRARRATRAEGVAEADAAQTREEARRDNRLRARLPRTDLARRLRDLMQDARTAREETGVATLSLALGGLAWRDPGTPETPRLAPLALLPVRLEREGVSQTFRLRAAAAEVQENLSLRQKLLVEFRVALPDFPAEDFQLLPWIEAVRAAIGERDGWGVEADSLAVGLFSFQKFLMWRDLDPAVNPALLTHPMIRALVGGEALPAARPFPDDSDVDAEIPVERADHVMEMDGSQALAAEAVRRGALPGAPPGHIVIQGPPGTGKSQVIADIIAQAVMDGRTVLFVAEKLAALEVVQRRLAGIGLGPACLELHSENPSKRAVLDALRQTLALPQPAPPDRDPVLRRLGALRSRLNGHARAMASPVGESGRPLHDVVGNLVRLRAEAVPAPDFTLPAREWDAARIAQARHAVDELAARAAEGGARSPWRGIVATLSASDRDRLLARLPELVRGCSGCATALAPVAAALRRMAPGPLAARSLLALARATQAVPRHDPDSMADAAWTRDPSPLRALAEAAERVRAARGDPRLRPGAIEVSGLAEARAVLSEPGGLFAFLSSERRAAKAVAERVATDPGDPLPALDAALAGQAAADALRKGDALGRAAFGRLWGDDPAVLSALVAWRDAHGPEAAAAVAAGLPALAEGPVEEACAAWDELRQLVQLDTLAAFGDPDPDFTRIASRLGDWAAQPEALPLWLAWRQALAEAGPELAPLAERLADGRLAPEAALPAFDYALDEALLKQAMRARPELAAFDGPAFDRLLIDFAEADRDRIALARAEAAAAHRRGFAEASGLPGYRLLRGEFEKKRGHLPLRDLLARAGRLVQALKPVFLMSPLSVAQFLAPDAQGQAFDLLVMDEASQIEPVDALGAIARCRQVVVVGDDRQMPPTRFFQRMTSEDEPAEDDAPEEMVAAREVESILGLSNARGVPNVMLRWHYRSRHESLIATSNAEFYGGRLLVLPSPRARSAALGLSLVKVAGRWIGSVNREEAQAVAEAVLHHARETPGETLGVAAFSLKQRDAILDALEALRRDNPDAEPFFTAHPHEPFFVKNLENVQGDERDAIFISVGYARDAEGRLAMRFGPLSADGGERRLNVLITRAKTRCLVFTGLDAEDIDLSRASGPGVAALKTFLRFAAAGDQRRYAGEAAAAPLAQVIAEEIRTAGLDPVARIGSAGVFLDVAARAEADFVLGVEADAADWAALRAARDRDLGRGAALGRMGWALHRAWGLAWLQRPEAERSRLQSALGAAPAAEAPAPASPDPGLAIPYVEAAPVVDASVKLPDLPFARLAETLAAVIRIEQPVQTEAVLERARLLWGLEALGAADRAALNQALRLAAQLQGVAESGGFWTAEGAPAPTPRDRRAAAPHLRRAAMLAPAEIEAAAQALLAALPGTTEPELVSGVVRLLGLEEQAAPAIAVRIAGLAGAGRLRPA